MRYLKYFESKEIELYKNDDFRITITNGSLSYMSNTIARSAIDSMADLIRTNSKYLSDKNMRNIPLRDVDIQEQIRHFELYTEKIKNIGKYHSGFLRYFFGYNEAKEIPDEVYKNLTIKYSPILINITEKSKSLGDIIDQYTVILKQLMIDLPLEMLVNKYNI